MVLLVLGVTKAAPSFLKGAELRARTKSSILLAQQPKRSFGSAIDRAPEQSSGDFVRALTKPEVLF